MTIYSLDILLFLFGTSLLFHGHGVVIKDGFQQMLVHCWSRSYLGHRLSHWAPTLQLFHISALGHCSPVPRNMLDWVCPAELLLASRRCFPWKNIFGHFVNSSIWPRILLFSGKFSFTLFFHLSYTWALSCTPLFYSMPAVLLNSELWGIGMVEVVVVRSLSCVQLCDPMDCSTRPGFPSFTISQSLLKLMSLDWCRPTISPSVTTVEVGTLFFFLPGSWSLLIQIPLPHPSNQLYWLDLINH